MTKYREKSNELRCTKHEILSPIPWWMPTGICTSRGLRSTKTSIIKQILMEMKKYFVNWRLVGNDEI